MNRNCPTPTLRLIRCEASVSQPASVEEFSSTICSGGPCHGGNCVDHIAKPLLTAPELFLGPVTLDPLRDAIRDEPQSLKYAFGERLSGEHGHDAHGPILYNERVAGKCGHFFLACPSLVADSRIVLHVIGEQRFSFLSDETDFELSNRNPAVRAIHVCVHSRACLQFQFVAVPAESPDTRKSCIEMPHHGLSTVL
jgi:hypothetical protein